MTELPFLPRCPTCDMTVNTTANSKFMPFCSERCQLIDLGRWLSEEIAIPVDRDDDNQDEPTPGKPVLPPGWHDA
jgi:uncharacterized protein